MLAGIKAAINTRVSRKQDMFKKTHSSKLTIPEYIHVIHTLTNDGVRLARSQNRNVRTRTGRSIVLNTKLTYIHTSSIYGGTFTIRCDSAPTCRDVFVQVT